jgi:hypothetical protein
MAGFHYKLGHIKEIPECVTLQRQWGPFNVLYREVVERRRKGT